VKRDGDLAACDAVRVLLHALSVQPHGLTVKSYNLAPRIDVYPALALPRRGRIRLQASAFSAALACGRRQVRLDATLLQLPLKVGEEVPAFRAVWHLEFLETA